MNEIIKREEDESAVVAAEMQRSVKERLEHALAPGTRQRYETSFSRFSAWCIRQGVSSLPATPMTVASYLDQNARGERSLSVSSLKIAVSAIRWHHKKAALPDPCAADGVSEVLRAVRREIGVRPDRKTAATTSKLVRMLAALGHMKVSDMRRARDRALLLFGFASAMRRSEIVSLEVSDIERVERGLVVRLRKSKTDQESAGHERVIPFGRDFCPIGALDSWLSIARIDSGRLFRSVDRHGNVGTKLDAGAVARIVKQLAGAAGMDPSEFSGHSLRAGFVTSASEAGASNARIADHTGHTSEQMIRVYTRRSDAFSDHAGDGLL